MNPIYLDYNASTPIDVEVVEFMKPFLENYYGNPSSSHIYGTTTKKAVESARAAVAALINCNPHEIVFTSGGTESNNYAIKGFAFANSKRGKHVITSSIEHPAVIEVCKYLENKGFAVTYLPVDNTGCVQVDDLQKAIRPDTILISIMHANNETGSIQPIAEIGAIARKHKIAFHTDAAQSAGKIPIDVNQLNVDLLSIAGHKIYAPKGIGALFVRNGIVLEKLIHGADHERNLRAGTENVLEIAGLGKACEIAKRDFSKNVEHFLATRNLLFSILKERLPQIKLNGHSENRLPNTLSISFKNIEANTILSELTQIAASAGAACHSDNITVSPVLLAMKVPIEYAMGTIRFSTGKYISLNEIQSAAEIIANTVEKLLPDSNYCQVTDNEDIKLTQFTHGLGCACKIRPQYLEKVLKNLPVFFDKNIIIGNENSDDAAVYRISENLALVQTLDFFTPIVDDPYTFGAIAAANALSDIYAMGATPIFALNIVAFPDNRLPIECLHQILKGAADKAAEAGIAILGGHTIEDSEPKFGMVVSGTINPKNIWSNNGAKAGDAIILTKPIGTGIISTAIKRGFGNNNLIAKVNKIMSTLNKKPAEIMKNYSISACTDVTGFGLLGHLKEICSASNVNAELWLNKIPIIGEAIEFATAGVLPGGTKNNLLFVEEISRFDESISEIDKYILADAQTSGGLLIFLPSKNASDLLNELHENELLEAEIIGLISNSLKPSINIKKSVQGE